MKRRPEKGDTYRWKIQDSSPVYLLVNRVARDGSWADIRCVTWSASWKKRQPLPLPEGTERYMWTQADLDRDALAYERRWNAPLCEAGIHEADGSCCAASTAAGGAEGDQSNGGSNG